MFNSSSARRHVLLAVVTLMGVGCYAGSDDGGGGAQPGLGKDDGLQAVEQTQRALATNDPWIGVVPSGDPATAPCAQGWAGIRMDDEDSSNANTFNFYNNSFGSVHMSGHNFSAGGLIHSASPGRAGGNTWLRYCPTQVNKLYPLRYDYAVISASNVCPTGSYRFSRRFDNEDSKNHNRFEGDISPNVSTTGLGATTINFCFVPRDPNGATWSSSFDGQIIFAAGNSGLNGIVTNSGTFGTDDEDDGNNNQFSSSAAEYTTRMRSIIAGGGNTVLYWATDSEIVTVDLGTVTSCDVAYLQQQQERQIQCTYGHGGGWCQVPGWGLLSGAYDKINNWFCKN